MNEGENSFDVKGCDEMEWQDPRLAFDASDKDSQMQIYLEEDAKSMF